MKKALTNLCLAAVAIPAYCQITLDQTNYPQPPDSVRVVEVTNQVTSLPARGSNQTWNYSSLTPTALYYNVYPAVSNDPDFPAAQFKTERLIKGLTPALGYFFDQYYEITASGAQAIGIHVPAQAYGLGLLTGNNTDTLYILDNMLYYPTTPRPIVAFPATGGSSWSSSLRHVVNMELTVSAASLNRTLMQQVFYLNRTDTVVGWGTLQLPALTGFNSNVPVLQDLISQYAVDSVYLGGSPAPTNLTNAFGITQGQITGPKYDRMVFYRAGEFNYQMMLNFKNNAFDSIISAFVNTALPQVTGINDVAAEKMSTVYPNPITGHQLFIQMNDASQAAKIELQDMTGRLLELVDVKNELKTIRIDMNEALPNGIYIYRVKDEKGNTLATGKVISAQ